MIVGFSEIGPTLTSCISELRRSFHKVSSEMNESGPGLSNAHLDIRNGCLTKKLELFKDSNKIRIFGGNHTVLKQNTIVFCGKHDSLSIIEKSANFVLIV